MPGFSISPGETIPARIPAMAAPKTGSLAQRVPTINNDGIDVVSHDLYLSLGIFTTRNISALLPAPGQAGF